MNKDAQRIAIAEACGWKKADPPNTPVWWKDGLWVMHDFDLPDYLNDLNEMHVAEKVLTEQEFLKYCEQLGLVLDNRFKCHGTRDAWRIHTAAEYRAEAFLKTLGKWRDE